MNHGELSNIISSSTNKVLEENKEIIIQNLSAIACYPKTSNEFKEALLGLFNSSVQFGAMASVKTLIDLGYLDVSE